MKRTPNTSHKHKHMSLTLAWKGGGGGGGVETMIDLDEGAVVTRARR
jgi:hypothetical protein